MKKRNREPAKGWSASGGKLKRKNKLLVILGPTSSGKSDLAVFLAKKYNGEIISADSRQLYTWMDIGTGKITKREMKGIPHHMLDVAHPSRQFTVVQYQKKALKIIRDIQRRGKLPILVGGTGLYIQAIVDRTVFPEVGPNRVLRSKLRNTPVDELFQKLQKLDPRRALSIEAENKRRLIRALEIIEATGKPVPRLANSKQQTMNNVLILGIKISREELNEKIKLRLKKRLKQRMIKEVKNLHEKYRVSWRGLEKFGLEYGWIARYLQNKISKEKMEEKLYRDIKNYAKRQMTWFKRDKRVRWIKNEQEAKILVQKFTQQ